MRRFAALVLTAVFALLVTGLVGRAPALSGAQGASPAAGPPSVDEGGLAADLGFGTVTAVDLPADLRLRRLALPPHFSITHMPEIDYDLSDASFVVHVEHGSLEVTFEEPAAEDGGIELRQPSNPERAEPLPQGLPVMLEAGDSLYFDHARYTVRNPNDQEPVFLTTAVLDPPEETTVVECCVGPKPRFP